MDMDVDLSLEEIVAQNKKESYRRNGEKNLRIYPNKSRNPNVTTDDARWKILKKNRGKISDARDRIVAIHKKSTIDARAKLNRENSRYSNENTMGSDMNNAKLFLNKILSNQGDWNSRRVRQDPARDRKITVTKRSANWAREKQKVQERFLERERAKRRDHEMRINAWKTQYFREYWNANIAGNLNEFHYDSNMKQNERNWQRNESNNYWNGGNSNENLSRSRENYNNNYNKYKNTDNNGNNSRDQCKTHTKSSYVNYHHKKYSY